MSTQLDWDTEGESARVREFLFLVIEAERPLAGGARFALDDLEEVTIGRVEGSTKRESDVSTAGGEHRLAIRLGDSFMSKDHAILRKQGRSWLIRDLGSKNGVHVNGARIDEPVVLAAGDVVALGRVFFVFDTDEATDGADLDAEDLSIQPSGFLTLLPSLMERLARLRQEAPRDTSITLVGETGTGKEVLAKAIHAASGRRGPYLAVNCGAIPRDLIQNELFGHVKGAFSGAAGATGYIRDAHQGTLLLDEIVAAPPPVQVALLRTIQEREVTPVGATRPHAVDTRFLAAAQRPLADAVEDGEFRADLQARLEALVFELPPLRERRVDIGIFVASTLGAMGVTEKDNPRLSPRAAFQLLRYGWPRNIRELAHAIRVGWGSAKNGEIRRSNLPNFKIDGDAPGPSLKQQIIDHLSKAGGNVAQAARSMGRTRTLLYHYCKRFDIDPESFRPR